MKMFFEEDVIFEDIIFKDVIVVAEKPIDRLMIVVHIAWSAAHADIALRGREKS